MYIGDDGSQSDMSILGPSHLHSAVITNHGVARINCNLMKKGGR